MTPPDNPFKPVTLRGRVVRWLEGTESWSVVDAIAHKYTGAPYGREQDRIVAVIELDHHKIGM